MIKKFGDFLEDKKIDEARLEGNPGIPGEEGNPGSYLKDTEKHFMGWLEDLRKKYGNSVVDVAQLSNELQSYQKGKEKDLEELAEKAIRLIYGRIIEDVVLDIKFPEEQEIPEMMKGSKEKPELPDEKIPFIELREREIISEVQKRKIINNITQGEAINSKKALNLPEVSQGIIKILGEKNGRRYIEILNQITDLYQSMYWTIPVQAQKEMWIKDKSKMSGAVGVNWEEKSKEDEDLAKDILNDIDDDGDIPEEAADLFSEIQPTIVARGVDFAMLIHETVKGVYELIASAAIPEDEEVAEIVMMLTDTLADEIDDLRYGPKIAADIRDYLNTFSEVRNEDVPNLREHILGRIYNLDAEEFLNVILSILNKDNKYRKMIEEMISDIIQEIKDFDLESVLGDAGIDNDDDYMPTDKEVKDYEELSKEEIEALIFDAAARGDFDEARRLHSLIKESEFADEMWAHIHTHGGYPSNVDSNRINESQDFTNLYKGTTLTLDVIDGKTREKKGTIKTKINNFVLEGDSYFMECLGDVNVVYDRDTQEFVEGYKNQYLVYRLDESNSHIFDLLK